MDVLVTENWQNITKYQNKPRWLFGNKRLILGSNHGVWYDKEIKSGVKEFQVRRD